jgi:inner membrane protein
VDIATHALASYALARGVFPRRRWPVIVGMVFAGTIADIDLLSIFFGPSVYFAARRTYTHSIVGTIVVILLAILPTRLLTKEVGEKIQALILPLFLAAAFHVALDVFQSEGVALLWPARAGRLALDWLPPIDPWILFLLLAGILFPELLRLVSSEIGAKNKAPRGRNGAIVTLGLIALYVVGRALLHSGSVAALEPHSYQGESARRVGAFPDSFSIFTWHGVIETESRMCIAEVPGGPGRNFDPENVECVNKPEPSPELKAAQNSRVAQEYLRVVPFPRASVAKTEDGYEVVIRSMRDVTESEIRHRVAAQIFLDSKPAVVNQELVWTRRVRLR